MTNIHKDAFGSDLVIGDIIIYGTKDGYGGGFTMAEVINMKFMRNTSIPSLVVKPIKHGPYGSCPKKEVEIYAINALKHVP